MTEHDVPLALLEETRRRLFRELPESLDGDERQFLLSMKEGTPAWERLGVPGIEALPALTWKLENVRKLQRTNPRKHGEQLANLRRKLALG